MQGSYKVMLEVIFCMGTGSWAQTNGRNNVSWEEKFEMDTWYVDNHSLKLDLTILWQTVTKVLRRTDINQAGYATAEKFIGNSGS